MFSIFSIFSRSKSAPVLPISVTDIASTSTTSEPTVYDHLRAAWQALVLAVAFVFTCGYVPWVEECSIQRSNSTISSFYAPDCEANLSPSMSTRSTMGPSLAAAAYVHAERRGEGSGVPVRIPGSTRPDPYTRLPSTHNSARRHERRVVPERNITSRNSGATSNVHGNEIGHTPPVVAPPGRVALAFPSSQSIPAQLSSPPRVVASTIESKSEESSSAAQVRSAPINDNPSPARYRRGSIYGGVHAAKLFVTLAADAGPCTSQSTRAEGPTSGVPIIKCDEAVPYKDAEVVVCPSASESIRPRVAAPREVPTILIHEPERKVHNLATSMAVTTQHDNLRVPEDDETSADRSSSPEASLFDPSLKSSSSFLEIAECLVATHRSSLSTASQCPQGETVQSRIEPETENKPRAHPEEKKCKAERPEVEGDRYSLSSASVYSQDQSEDKHEAGATQETVLDYDNRSVSSASRYSVQSEAEEKAVENVELEYKIPLSSCTPAVSSYTNRFRRAGGESVSSSQERHEASSLAVAGVPAEGDGNRCSKPQGLSLRSEPRFQVRMQDPTKSLTPAKSIPMGPKASSSTPIRDSTLHQSRPRRNAVVPNLRVQIPTHPNGSSRLQLPSKADQSGRPNEPSIPRPPTPISDPETPTGPLPSPPQTPAKRSSLKAAPNTIRTKTSPRDVSTQDNAPNTPILPNEERRRSTGPTTSSRLKTRKRTKGFVVGPDAPPMPTLPSNLSLSPPSPPNLKSAARRTPTPPAESRAELCTPPDSPKAESSFLAASSHTKGDHQSSSEARATSRMSAGRSHSGQGSEIPSDAFQPLGSSSQLLAPVSSDVAFPTSRRRAVYFAQPPSLVHSSPHHPTSLNIISQAPPDHFAKTKIAFESTPSINNDIPTRILPSLLHGQSLRSEHEVTSTTSVRGTSHKNEVKYRNAAPPKLPGFPSRATSASISCNNAHRSRVGRYGTQTPVWI